MRRITQALEENKTLSTSVIMENYLDLTNSCTREKKEVAKKNYEIRNELKVRYVPQFKVIKKCSNFEEESESKFHFNQIKQVETKVREIGKESDRRKRGKSIIPPKKINTSIITIPSIKEEADHNKVFNGGKELFIYLSIINDGMQQWFKIDPNGTSLKGKAQILSPICSIPANNLPCYYRTIGFDSKLYVMGGYSGKEDLDDHGQIKHCARSKVFVCDTSSTNPVWEESSSMKSCKISPQLAVVDGEIFAIGSWSLMNFQFKEPHAEVFNPSHNTWTALPSPPHDVHIYGVTNSVFLRDRDEIIIFPSGSGRPYPRDAYRFNVKSHLWTRFSDPFKIPSDKRTTSVAVGDVVFRLQENRLYACDMSQPKPIGRRVYGLEKEIKSLMWSGHHLFYIGNGKLCLTWCFDSKEHCGMTVIACLKFWVAMCNKKPRMQAVIDRCDHYLANGSPIFPHCVAM